MQDVFTFATGLCVILIVFVYPFAAVWRGRPVESAVKISWAMQVVFFTGLCFGIPAIGSLYSRELEFELATKWVPDAPVIVPIFAFGWMYPLMVGYIASVYRK